RRPDPMVARAVDEEHADARLHLGNRPKPGIASRFLGVRDHRVGTLRTSRLAGVSFRRRQPSSPVRSLSSISHAWSSVWKAEWRMRNGSVHDRMRFSTLPALYARIAAT